MRHAPGFGVPGDEASHPARARRIQNRKCRARWRASPVARMADLRSFLPRSLSLKKTPKPRIRGCGAVQQGGEGLELLVRQCEITPVEQHCFGFTGSSVEHELRTVASEYVGSSVNECFL